jgi:serine/threonine-protein kinase
VEVLERYELLERIAGGGMGEVYRARASGAHGFAKVLALKRILPQLSREKKFEERFIAEAKLAAELTHANIVQVMDFGRLGGSLYLAMEYVDGLDLAHLMKVLGDRDERLPLATIVQIGAEICKGLAFAHRRGVVHRDISPANVLLSRAGEVKIADFGVARAADRSSLFRTGTIVGKWHYMSPEQMRAEVVDQRTDIFAAGIVLHEACTGQPLFHGRTFDAVRSEVCATPIPGVSALRPDLPAGIDAVLGQALARERDHRFVDADGMLREWMAVGYEHGIVPTPLDVARVVEEATAVAAPAAPDLDAHIAAQMGRIGVAPAGRTARRTVQRAGTAAPAAAGKFEKTLTFIRAAPAPNGVAHFAAVADEPAARGIASSTEIVAGPGRRRHVGAWIAAAVGCAGAVAGVALALTGDDVARSTARVAAPTPAPPRAAHPTPVAAPPPTDPEPAAAAAPRAAQHVRVEVRPPGRRNPRGHPTHARPRRSYDKAAPGHRRHLLQAMGERLSRAQEGGRVSRPRTPPTRRPP